MRWILLALVSFILNISCCSAFVGIGSSSQGIAFSNIQRYNRNRKNERLCMSQLNEEQPNRATTTENEGVVELLSEEEEKSSVEKEESEEKFAAPFISQGEIAEDVLNPDFSDPKQTRVIIYTVISLLPVLLLIPLMLSRELIPLENLPPVDM